MAYEVETKVLNIDAAAFQERMRVLGVPEVLRTRLTVDWFRPKGDKEGQTPWYLRIRTNSQGVSEVTWKGQSEILGAARKHREINVKVADSISMASLFEVLGLEQYAHQEKDRISWTYQDWKFELDQYPGMPPYLEIEGRDEAHIQEALSLVGLKSHATSSEGERVLISKIYGLNWYDMRF